jgi:DNA-binding IscR family transcriptional regulator
VITADRLAGQLEVPVRAVRDVLAVLEHHRIVSPSTPEDRESGYQLGRPASDVRIADVLNALRGNPRLPGRDSGEPATSARLVGGVVLDLARAVRPIAVDRSIGDLLESMPECGVETPVPGPVQGSSAPC